jgi:hypothetical protein
MKHVSKCLLVMATFCVTTVSAIATTFINGGFEAANLTGWTLHSGTWNSTSQTQNDSQQGDSAIVSSSGTTDANTLGHLYEVLEGSDSLRLNNSANGAHFSTLTQTVVGRPRRICLCGLVSELSTRR